MKKVAERAGCRVAFDNFASMLLPLCNFGESRKYFNLANQVLAAEQKSIINQTGCLVPCTYREYKLVREPTQEPSATKTR